MLGAAVTACCMHIAPVLFSHRLLSDRLSACLSASHHGVPLP